PLDSRLPGCGGDQICGLYDLTPAKFGLSATVVSRDDVHTEVYNGYDIGVDVRLPKGFNLNGRLNGGRTETNDCASVLNNPQISFANAQNTLAGAPTGTTAPRANAYCDVVPPWSADTQVKFSGTI